MQNALPLATVKHSVHFYAVIVAMHWCPGLVGNLASYRSTLHYSFFHLFLHQIITFN